MFDPAPHARVFGVPIGADFAWEFTKGLVARLDNMSPADQARVQVFVNTSRMKRQVVQAFDSFGPRLLPRIRLISEMGDMSEPDFLPAPVPPLQKRLELVSLVRQLLQAAPEIAPRSALFQLADSLAGLMDEMQSEGVEPSALKALDVTDQSGHWQRALAFVTIVEEFLEASQDRPDTLGRQRQIAEALADQWAAQPPDHPVIVAGSTGSRGATAVFMTAVANLPQGAVVLPGFDYDLPDTVWDSMSDVLTAEDHPQFRYRKIMDIMEVPLDGITRWSDADTGNEARNRLVSLALRPAPVTDAWLQEGPHLPDLRSAATGLALIEAPDPRSEANAIALVLRDALAQGKTAALISPDKVLTRQVKAALARWSLVPDDSTGDPIPQSPPGRIMRQIADLYGERVTADALLRLLKHPLTHAGIDRGPHLRRTRELELRLRKEGIAYPEAPWMHAWAAKTFPDDSAEAARWVDWVAQTVLDLPDLGEAPLETYLDDHQTRTKQLVAGPDGDEAPLWQQAAGRKVEPLITEFRRIAPLGGMVSARDFGSLLYGVLSQDEVRDRDAGDPRLSIWGTQEARVGRADIMILGGLTEGAWPTAPKPDPWLNRAMRARVGLNLPERQIGLSAHDFQQAISAPDVILSRTMRSDDAQTVPSRWLNRLTNLMSGLPENGGKEALAEMRARGQIWVDRAKALEAHGDTPRALRPSPCPPVSARPKELSVTEIQTLIRDPYAIYAKHILRLKKLDPLGRDPDARLRGTVLHRVLELFIKEGKVTGVPADKERLLATADKVLAEEVPWSVTRTFYKGRIERFADWFVKTEAQRQTRLENIATERSGGLQMTIGDFKLVAKADRIDRDADGRLHLFDYKSGAAPKPAVQTHFDKQLLLMAMMAEDGAFDGIDPAEVASAIYISLNGMEESPAPLDKEPPDKIKAEFHSLLSSYREPDKGYTSRRAVMNEANEGDFDQLARFGEWEPTDDAVPEELK